MKEEIKTPMTLEEKKERQKKYNKKYYEAYKNSPEFIERKKGYNEKAKQVKISKLLNELELYKQHFGELPK